MGDDLLVASGKLMKVPINRGKHADFPVPPTAARFFQVLGMVRPLLHEHLAPRLIEEIAVDIHIEHRANHSRGRMVRHPFEYLYLNFRSQSVIVPLCWIASFRAMLEHMVLKGHHARPIPLDLEAGAAPSMRTAIHLRALVRTGAIGAEKALGIRTVVRLAPFSNVLSQRRIRMKCQAGGICVIQFEDGFNHQERSHLDHCIRPPKRRSRSGGTAIVRGVVEKVDAAKNVSNPVSANQQGRVSSV
jgi:hypothetical protein